MLIILSSATTPHLMLSYTPKSLPEEDLARLNDGRYQQFHEAGTPRKALPRKDLFPTAINRAIKTICLPVRTLESDAN